MNIQVPDKWCEVKPLDDPYANHDTHCICSECYNRVMNNAQTEFLTWFQMDNVFMVFDMMAVFDDLWEGRDQDYWEECRQIVLKE